MLGLWQSGKKQEPWQVYQSSVYHLANFEKSLKACGVLCLADKSSREMFAVIDENE